MKKILFTALMLALIINPLRAQEKVDFNETTTKIIDGKEYIFYKNKAFTGVLLKVNIEVNPSITTTYEVKEGLMHGKSISTLSDGNVAISNLVNNLFEGQYEEYYPNGKLKQKGNFSNDKLDGELLRYNENGGLHFKAYYSLGKNIDVEYYGSEGELLSKHTTDESGKGTLTDFRDNQTYKTITLTIFGDIQQTWMAQNLNFKTESSISYETNKKLKKKYPDMENAGMAYNWADAKEACPAGWHLPAKLNWELLIEYFGGKEVAGNALKSNQYWHKEGNGTNSSGFNALPTGGFNHNRKTDGDFGKKVYFLSSTLAPVFVPGNRWIGYSLRWNNPEIEIGYPSFSFPNPCRCVLFNPE